MKFLDPRKEPAAYFALLVVLANIYKDYAAKTLNPQTAFESLSVALGALILRQTVTPNRSIVEAAPTHNEAVIDGVEPVSQDPRLYGDDGSVV